MRTGRPVSDCPEPSTHDVALQLHARRSGVLLEASGVVRTRRPLRPRGGGSFGRPESWPQRLEGTKPGPPTGERHLGCPWKATSQVRFGASFEREELLEDLSEDKQVPCTYSKVAHQIGGSQYENISQERPLTLRAQDPSRYRIRSKRPGYRKIPKCWKTRHVNQLSPQPLSDGPRNRQP